MCPNCQFLPFGLIHSQWKETLSPDQPRLGKYIMLARQQVKKALCPGKPRIWAHILWDQPLDRAWAFEREPRLASSLHPTCLPTGTEIMECSWMYCKARTIKSNLAFLLISSDSDQTWLVRDEQKSNIGANFQILRTDVVLNKTQWSFLFSMTSVAFILFRWIRLIVVVSLKTSQQGTMD